MATSSIARLAECMLRALGGCEVRLLLAPAATGDAASHRLGLASASLEEVPCCPVVVRTPVSREQRAQYELLFSASSLQRILEERGKLQPEVMFASARGVLCGATRLQIERVEVEQFAGEAYLYRVTATEQ